MNQPCHPWTDDDLISRGISYRGFGLPVSHLPFKPTEGELALITERTAAVSAAAELAVAAYAADPSVRRLYAYGPLQEACIMRDPGYRPLIPLGRWDSFLFPDGPRFMEYNTDGTAGWHYTTALTALWREWAGLPPQAAPLTGRLLDTILFCFRQWDRRGVERPRIAIVDWAEVGTRADQDGIAAFFTAAGFPTTVEDPRALKLEGGRLVGPAGPIDVVYRRLVSEEAFRRAEEIRPFLDAYLEGAACFVGSFRTDPAWSKTLFVLLSDPAFSYLWPERLKPHIEASIPWTRDLRPGPTRYKVEELDMVDLLLSRRDQFILKPSRGYEGRGVLLGSLTAATEWRQAVMGALERGDTLVQEMLRPAPVPLDEGRPGLPPGRRVRAPRPARGVPRAHQRHPPHRPRVPRALLPRGCGGSLAGREHQLTVEQ